MSSTRRSTVRGALGIAIGAMLLAGCAAQAATPPVGRHAGAARMTPGMVMPDGSTMGAGPPSHGMQPSVAARMICADETAADLTTVLRLPTRPAGHPTWSAPVYTCTYHLPMGRLVLSVTASPSPAAAERYVRDQQGRLPGAHRLVGLTSSAFGNDEGVVLLRKDADTLRVDATRLPRSFGPDREQRSDFAYEIASDILGCWTGD